MNRTLRVLLSVALIATMLAGQAGAVCASNLSNNVEVDTNSTVLTGTSWENFKAEFAYQMAEITAKIVGSTAAGAERFKVEFAYATALVTAVVMPLLPSAHKDVFAYEMARITTKIINSPDLDIEKAKIEFTYEIAQLTSKIVAMPDKNQANTSSQKNLYTEPRSVERPGMSAPKSGSPAGGAASPASADNYGRLINEVKSISDRQDRIDAKVKADGELRYHYAANSGNQAYGKDSSGLRARLGFESNINKDWQAFGMLEGQYSLLNYNNQVDLNRLYVKGNIGTAKLTAGAFGYLMAEGNIYDSRFKGASVEFGDPIKYTFSYGKTDYTKDTYIATAKYSDFDYNVEAGVYRYVSDDVGTKNTIKTLSGNYNFSNFGIGAMYLDADLKGARGKSSGYVLRVDYGDLKTYRAGTYDFFVKRYNQPKGTYIAHGMNADTGLLQGFKGFAIGTHYTFAPNLVAGLEYYRLADQTTGQKGETLFGDLTRYF